MPMIEETEFNELKEDYEKASEDLERELDIDVLNEKAEALANCPDSEELRNELIKTQQKMNFMAKYAVDEQVAKNFKTLQGIIDDAPKYTVYETANGAKLIRTSGTDNKDRITALNAFFKYNLKTPDSNGAGSQHIHLHDNGASDLISNLLRGKEDSTS